MSQKNSQLFLPMINNVKLLLAHPVCADVGLQLQQEIFHTCQQQAWHVLNVDQKR